MVPLSTYVKFKKVSEITALTPSYLIMLEKSDYEIDLMFLCVFKVKIKLFEIYENQTKVNLKHIDLSSSDSFPITTLTACTTL